MTFIRIWGSNKIIQFLIHLIVWGFFVYKLHHNVICSGIGSNIGTVGTWFKHFLRRIFMSNLVIFWCMSVHWHTCTKCVQNVLTSASTFIYSSQIKVWMWKLYFTCIYYAYKINTWSRNVYLHINTHPRYVQYIV